jgi:hypothetical protein
MMVCGEIPIRMPTLVAKNGGGGFLFFRRGNLRFCRGFCEKRCAERGFLMVKSWWNAGERWSENDLKSTLKIFHGFQVYFWAFPFWEWEELG